MNNKPSIAEFTLRGILLGSFITLIFTASNVYLGLKIGSTFASSIPAAVISMAFLRMFKNSSILENNIVQTLASSAGCISAVIFVIPALIMIGYWNSFPFWKTFLICAAGGVLGVIFTIPLRNALVVRSSLPYPEGVAAAEILKSANEASEEDNRNETNKGVKLLAFSTLISGLFSLCTGGFKLFTGGVSMSGMVGASVFSISAGFSFALLGSGFLIGVGGGVSLLIGTFLCHGIGVPILSAVMPMDPEMSPEEISSVLWATKLRFCGAGCIAISAVWTLIVLIKPIIKGFRESLILSRQASEGEIDSSRTDMGFRDMLFYFSLSVAIIVAVFYDFVSAVESIPYYWVWVFVIVGTLLAIFIGFVLASACGYMAGLIGSSSSPISGITIISVIVISFVYLLLSHKGGIFDVEGGENLVTAFTLFSATLVCAISTISNDNMQDLKTGYLIGASPKHQQVALIIGTIIGALVIAPVLEVLYNSYGFTDAFPREGMDPSMALNAPQASLMTSIVKGIFHQDLQWSFIAIGIGIGCLCIVINFILRKISGNKLFIAPLAVGLGIYLPSSTMTVIVIGAFSSFFIYNVFRKGHYQIEKKELVALDKRINLVAAGLIVGESLVGVIIAMILTISIASSGSDSPLAMDFGLAESTKSALSFLVYITGFFYVVRMVLNRGRQQS